MGIGQTSKGIFIPSQVCAKLLSDCVGPVHESQTALRSELRLAVRLLQHPWNHPVFLDERRRERGDAPGCRRCLPLALNYAHLAGFAKPSLTLSTLVSKHSLMCDRLVFSAILLSSPYGRRRPEKGHRERSGESGGGESAAAKASAARTVAASATAMAMAESATMARAVASMTDMEEVVGAYGAR
jgi:hypothetical protein